MRGFVACAAEPAKGKTRENTRAARGPVRWPLHRGRGRRPGQVHPDPAQEAPRPRRPPRRRGGAGGGQCAGRRLRGLRSGGDGAGAGRRAQADLSVRAHQRPGPRALPDRGPRLPRRASGRRRAGLRVSARQAQGIRQVDGGAGSAGVVPAPLDGLRRLGRAKRRPNTRPTAPIIVCWVIADARPNLQATSNRSGQPLDQRARVGHGAEDAALHLDHLDGGEVVAVVGRRGAVLHQQALEAAVVGLAHGGVHADVGRDAGEYDVADALACAAAAPGRWRRRCPCPACR